MMPTSQETNTDNKLMDKVVALCKRRGFIFPGSDIYGGLANSWDYGPYGVELKNNIKKAWWKSGVYLRNDIYGMDSAIIMHPRTWEASGHVKNFSDPLVDCKECKSRFRVDHLNLKSKCSSCNYTEKSAIPPNVVTEMLRPELAEGTEVFTDALKDILKKFLDSAEQPCPKCGKSGVIETHVICPVCGKKDSFNKPRKFNLMFKTCIGPVEDNASIAYLRPETAQGMFVNFANILDSRHPKLPFGLAQIGKSFRNEITPGNFTFRTREFEQMEIEYFCRPEDSDRFYEEWVEARKKWYLDLGIKPENIRFRRHSDDELAHYARACTDVEYLFPWGWSELEGIANRTDFDLKQHAEYSGKDLTYFDPVEKKRFFPYIIEPSGGVDRCLLAFLTDAYHEEQVKEDTRIVLRLSAKLAPVKAAVLPLLKNRAEIVGIAKELSAELKESMHTVYDDTANIGKLYRRQDEVGTLFCVTVDTQTPEDKQVTVRDRDTMRQERIPLEKVKQYISDKL